MRLTSPPHKHPVVARMRPLLERVRTATAKRWSLEHREFLLRIWADAQDGEDPRDQSLMHAPSPGWPGPADPLWDWARAAISFYYLALHGDPSWTRSEQFTLDAERAAHGVERTLSDSGGAKVTKASGIAQERRTARDAVERRVRDDLLPTISRSIEKFGKRHPAALSAVLRRGLADAVAGVDPAIGMRRAYEPWPDHVTSSGSYDIEYLMLFSSIRVLWAMRDEGRPIVPDDYERLDEIRAELVEEFGP